METELKKVEKRGNKWCVVHCHGKDKGKIIKCFNTKEEADRMHRAIESNKSKSIFTFYTDDFSFKSIETENEKKYYVTGYISTYDKDLVDDIVTKNCMSDMLLQLKDRNIKLDIEHESFRGDNQLEKEINKTIIPIGRIVEADIDEKGIKIKAILNSAHSRFNEVWNSVKGKFLDAFSIAYIPIKTIPKAKARLLDKLSLLNVALTGNPVNTEAKMYDVFTKSLDFTTEDENEEEDGLEVKARPDKAWWDSCTDKAKHFATDEAKFCGWLWQQSGGKWGRLKQAFGKSLIDIKDLEETFMDEEKKEETKEEIKGEEKEEAKEEKIENKSEGQEEVKEDVLIEVKGIKESIEKIKDEVKELKSFFNKVEYKAKTEIMNEKLEKKDIVKSEPLDMVGR